LFFFPHHIGSLAKPVNALSCLIIIYLPSDQIFILVYHWCCWFGGHRACKNIISARFFDLKPDPTRSNTGKLHQLNKDGKSGCEQHKLFAKIVSNRQHVTETLLPPAAAEITTSGTEDTIGTLQTICSVSLAAFLSYVRCFTKVSE